MPLHDAYARITPYELLLPEEDFADRRFPLIRQEAEERQEDLVDPERFALLSEAGAILRLIRGEEDDPRRLHQLGVLLFHAFHFWRMGLPLFVLDTGVVRYLVEGDLEAEPWQPRLPSGAGYVQLPQHLFWVPGSDDDPAESLDGFFWSAPDGENLSLLVAMGIRRDRPGLSVVPLPTLPLISAAEWARMKVRPEGRDFASSLPGADLDRLYSLVAGAEAVKLAMEVFWYMDVFPGAVAPGSSRAEGVVDGGQGPRPSGLAARRVVLKGD